MLAVWAGPAAAWIEQTPKSLLSVIDVERDGHATVSHELVLEIRGGPLKTLELGTSDTDAELLPDATVTRLAGGIPIPLLVERHADGSLGMEIDLPKGIRGGTYVFKVRYRTDLAGRDRLRTKAGAVEIAWVGPRLDAGIDGARAIFRLAPSDQALRLPAVDRDDPDPGFGVMVSSVRHTPEADEIELVRSHVARGEPVLWRVEASANALHAPSAASATLEQGAPAAHLVPPRAGRSLRWPLICAAFGLLAALVTAAKERLQRGPTGSGAVVPRPVVPLPLWARAPLAGGLLAAGLYFGNELEEPTLTAAVVLVAMAFVMTRAPRLVRPPRGPGRWLLLKDDEAFTPRVERKPGGWLDSGTLPGVLTLTALLGAVVALALSELVHSPCRALLVGLGGAALVPVFFTGRVSDLAADRVGFSRRFMRTLALSLRGRVRAKAAAWGRVPDGSGEPDELRVLIQPKDCIEGLVALETGLDAQRGLGGVVGVPFVIVRAKEGSRAQSALPRGVIWTRGRKPDERVAILSPKLPTIGL
ncbi:MAG TPA: hypothetical protein VGQ57_04610, partial [Polyangiaceae bacterium]|nr:hypothetical protein [Polyangiaceae bacterium]